MKNTIKSKERITWLFNNGSRYFGAGFLLLYCPLEAEAQEAHEAGRVAFIAGKKLGTAPLRNRAKRRLREAAAEAGAPWSGYDVVLVAKQSIFKTEFSGLTCSLRQFGEKLEQEGREGCSEPAQEGPEYCSAHEQEETKEKKEKKRTIISFVVGIPSLLAIVCISIYRHAISPLLPPSCRYVPTCSEYALIAFRRFGFLRGMWLSIKRVGRCHPFHPGGYDPVPEEFRRKASIIAR